MSDMRRWQVTEVEFSDRTLVALMSALIAMDEKTPIKKCVEIAKELLDEVEGGAGGGDE